MRSPAQPRRSATGAPERVLTAADRSAETISDSPTRIASTPAAANRAAWSAVKIPLSPTRIASCLGGAKHLCLVMNFDQHGEPEASAGGQQVLQDQLIEGRDDQEDSVGA